MLQLSPSSRVPEGKLGNRKSLVEENLPGNRKKLLKKMGDFGWKQRAPARVFFELGESYLYHKIKEALIWDKCF